MAKPYYVSSHVSLSASLQSSAISNLATITTDYLFIFIRSKLLFFKLSSLEFDALETMYNAVDFYYCIKDYHVEGILLLKVKHQQNWLAKILFRRLNLAENYQTWDLVTFYHDFDDDRRCVVLLTLKMKM